MAIEKRILSTCVGSNFEESKAKETSKIKSNLRRDLQFIVIHTQLFWEESRICIDKTIGALLDHES